jgi:hypothetical protein
VNPQEILQAYSPDCENLSIGGAVPQHAQKLVKEANTTVVARQTPMIQTIVIFMGNAAFREFLT